MDRRTTLMVLGGLLAGSGAGCVDEQATDDDPTGSAEPLVVRLYSYMEETAVTYTVEAEADDTTVVSETLTLEAPETIFTDEVVGEIPAGTATTTIAATAEYDGQQVEDTASFTLPKSDPVESFEVRVSEDGSLSVDTVGYDSPG